MKTINLNKFLIGAGITSFFVIPVQAKKSISEKTQKNLNILLITADDLNYSSTGFWGCNVPDITPSLDKLASRGMIFKNAHVNCAVSQPSRAALATGMYPHRNGVEGFYHTDKNIPTLMSVLRDHGYLVGIAGKVAHSTPIEEFKWDTAVDQADLGQGRNPQRYYEVFKEFVVTSKERKKPFYFMLNSHDPHRPFHGSEADVKMSKNGTVYPAPSRIYAANEIEVPGFLPDIPAVRTELAQYFSSVRRLDDTVGAVLEVLKEEGILDNTLIIFLSDNGISEPFAKTNVYLNSTRTPLIVSLPGGIKPGTRNLQEFVSGIDIMPTVLDICGIDIPENIDGRSFLPLLKGEFQYNRNRIFTQFYETSASNRYPMFAVQDKKYEYIYNVWSDGRYQFKNDSQGGIAFKGMVDAGKTDFHIQKRVEFLWYRVPEEFYDLENDPNALNNLINDPRYFDIIAKYRQELLTWMKQYESSATEAFEKLCEYNDLRIKYLEEDRAKIDNRKKKQRSNDESSLKSKTISISSNLLVK